MISLYHPSAHRHAHTPAPRWAPVVAMLLSTGSFVATFASMSPPPTLARAPVSSAPPRAEAVSWVTPSAPLRARAIPRLPVVSARPLRTGRVADVPVLAPRTPDTAATSRTASSPARAPLAPEMPGVAPLSARLIPRSGVAREAGDWLVRPGQDPFAERTAPTPAVRDSMLGELRAALPAMAQARRATPAERDEAMRDAARRRRVGVGIREITAPQAGGSIPAPLFSPGPSRAERVRDSLSYAEGRARLARLAARAARAESLRIDSVRADSTRAVQPP